MKKFSIAKQFASTFLALSIFIMPLSMAAQTRIVTPKNKYQISDDIKLGRETAQQVEQQLPILRDQQVTNYVADIGERLVAAIPAEFQRSEFRYSFKVVNASDINAFALPGGPMYVNRGMIEAAKNEGEMAGVMAHEISHVALRHGTAQATKQSSAKSQILGIGAILGGAILAGEAGAQLGAVGAQAYFTKFSREYETQSDILGSQILAQAGYDPQDLANMFRTIERQSGGNRAPQWLSSHPNPGNRYNRINQEAALLRVSNNPIKVSREFQDVQARLRQMPRARTTAELERGGGSGGGQNYPDDRRGGSGVGGGGYARSVESPSSRYRAYNGNSLSFNVPDNWQDYSSGNTITFAPEGAYGSDGLTHGIMIGTAQANNRNLQTAAQNYVSALLQDQGNSYLRQADDFARGTISGRNAVSTSLVGQSPVTGQNEVVNIYITQLRDGNLLYVATVTPQNSVSNYNRAFTTIIRSLQVND